MKIMLVHNFYQNFGGEDLAALADKSLLENHGQQVFFYTRDNKEISAYSLRERFALPVNTIYSWRTRKEVCDIVQQFRPDVAYIQNFFPLISPSVYHTLHRLRVPVVQVVHDFRFMCPNGLFYTEGSICERCKTGNYLNAVYHRCYRDSYSASIVASSVIGFGRFSGMLERISAFVCLTEFSRMKLIEAGVPEEKIFIKPHCIDISEIRPKSGDGDHILFLGRLAPEKGIWTLIRACSELGEVPLKIVGTGPLEHDLRRYVREKRLRNVEIVGFKSGSEKWDLLLNSLFVVVPSEWYETFCLVVMEAYAAGKPVIGSNLGSLPFVIENGKSGILFTAGDSTDLREKITHLLEHPSERSRMGEYGRRVVGSKYDPESVYRSLIGIFSHVISSNSERRQRVS